MVVVLVQVVVLVGEALGAILLVPTLLGKREFHTSFQRRCSSRGETLTVITVRKTRLTELDYHQQREPQQETGEGWP